MREAKQLKHRWRGLSSFIIIKYLVFGHRPRPIGERKILPAGWGWWLAATFLWRRLGCWLMSFYTSWLIAKLKLRLEFLYLRLQPHIPEESAIQHLSLGFKSFFLKQKGLKQTTKQNIWNEKSCCLGLHVIKYIYIYIYIYMLKI